MKIKAGNKHILTLNQAIVWTTKKLDHLLTLKSPVVYLGRVVGFCTTELADLTQDDPEIIDARDVSADAWVVFATPHGIITKAHPSELSEPSVEQMGELLALEALATEKKRVLYGGQVAIREILKS